jgi:hypothetical protein
MRVVMRHRSGIAIVAVAFAGCASTYDCGRFQGEPAWQLTQIEPLAEKKLLGVVSEHRDSPMNSLSSGFQLYRADDGRLLVCVPPAERALRGKAGCFAERYVVRPQGESYVFAADLSMICT